MKLPEATIAQLLSIEYCINATRDIFISDFKKFSESCIKELRSIQFWYRFRPRLREKKVKEVHMKFLIQEQMLKAGLLSLKDTAEFIEMATGVDEDMKPITFSQMKQNAQKQN